MRPLGAPIKRRVGANASTLQSGYKNGENQPFPPVANSTCYSDVAEVYYGYTRGNLTTVSRHDLSGRATPWQGYAMATDA